MLPGIVFSQNLLASECEDEDVVLKATSTIVLEVPSIDHEIIVIADFPKANHKLLAGGKWNSKFFEMEDPWTSPQYRDSNGWHYASQETGSFYPPHVFVNLSRRATRIGVHLLREQLLHYHAEEYRIRFRAYDVSKCFESLPFKIEEE